MNDATLIVNNAPECLRTRPQWVCWKYIVRGGKQTKCPMSVASAREASSMDPATWATFEQVVAAYQQSDDLAGVGFVFSADDQFCGIDLDSSIDPAAGELKPWARRIVERLDSYTEISPSGHGVKVFIQGCKPGAKCRKGYEDGEVEIYDSARFFTVTGRRLDGPSAQVEPRQDQLAAIYHQVFANGKPTAKAPPPAPPPAGPAPTLGDDKIIKLAQNSKSAGKFNSLWAGKWEGSYTSQSEADSALVFMLAFYTKDGTQIDRLFRQSGLHRAKWDEQHGELTYGAATIANALATVTKQYQPRGQKQAKPAAIPTAAPDGRPVVLIDTEEHAVVEASVKALARDPDIYKRGGLLVRVTRDPVPETVIRRPEGSAIITFLPATSLRERLTRVAMFFKLDRNGKPVLTHPTPWLVGAVLDRGEWPVIRPLLSISDTPILRPDGSVCQTAGYDVKTGVLYSPSGKYPAVPDRPTRDDALRAWAVLSEIVADFPFEHPSHRSAWLAALLTPSARFAFPGPSPLFLIDGNVRGVGKGLLAQTIGWTVLGREMSVSGYAHDPEEMRKRITAIAIAADRMVLLDNIDGHFGNASLDRALTCTRWKDRVLGLNKEVDLPLIPIWYATGNNILVAADTARRIIHIRLDILDERPEKRSEFKHPDLLSWIDQNRPALLISGLTILAAYCAAGRPAQQLSAFGSFEGWSGLVRSSVAWLGLPDPCLTQDRLVEDGDTAAQSLVQLFGAWQQYFPANAQVIVSNLVAQLYPTNRSTAPNDDGSVAMRAALENLVACQPGKAPTARQVGNRFRHFRRRVVNGLYLCIDEDQKRSAGAVWQLRQTGGNGSSESGESVLTTYAGEQQDGW